MNPWTFDHLVVVAPELNAGRMYIEELLGAPMSPGGVHPAMGTRNALMKIGPQSYLEVIAIDPEIPAPGRPRWFGLDDLSDDSVPSLATWVVRTMSVAEAAAVSPWGAESVEAMSRGALRWKITIPPADVWRSRRQIPLLIQWDDETHPSEQLPDVGIQLASLCLTDPDPTTIRQLIPIPGCHRDGHLVSVHSGSPGMVASLQTPRGTICLGSEL